MPKHSSYGALSSVRASITRSLVFFAAVLSAFFARPVAASIRIHPGVYEITTLVTRTAKGPEAVFNLKSRSELRIHLTGRLAKSLDPGVMQTRKIKIKVTHELESPRGEAELLSVASSENAPPRVGNDLVPVPRKEGY